MTYMALMAALNVTFALVTMFIPLAGLFLAIALPLTSALVAMNTDMKYYPIYMIATLSLSLIVTMQQLETTLFYIFPSLILGFAFGYLYKNKWADAIILIVASFIELGLLYFTIALIDVIFMVDFLESLGLVLGITTSNDTIIIPSILYVVSLAQTTVTYFIMTHELDRLTTSVTPFIVTPRYLYIIGLIVSIIIIPLGFLLPELSFILLGPSFLLMGFALYELIKTKRKLPLFIVVGYSIFAIFIFAIIFPLLGSILGLLLIAIWPAGIILLRICDFYLPK